MKDQKSHYARTWAVLAAASVGGVSPAAVAVVGDVDFSFGVLGVAKGDLGGLRDRADALESGVDGRVYALGRDAADSSGSVFEHYVVTRYLADGRLDTSFGGNGQLRLPASSLPAADYRTLAIDERHQRLYLGGDVCDETLCSGIVTRVLFSGEVDALWGRNGSATLFTPGTTSLRSLLVAPDCGVVVGGHVAGRDAFLVRLRDRDGALDPAFNHGALQRLPLSSPGASVEKLAVDASGRIVLASRSRSAVELLRVSADGALDAAFAGVSTTLALSSDALLALRADAAGIALAYGSDLRSDIPSLTVIRFDMDGALLSDPQSVGSIVSPQIYAYSSGSVATDDGALILGGRIRGSNNQDMGLLKVMVDGPLGRARPGQCAASSSDDGSGSDSGSGSGSGSDSGSGSGTGTDSGADSGSGSGTGTDSGSGSGADSGSGSGSGTGTDSGSGSGSGSGTGTDSGSGSGTGTDSGSGSGTGTDSGSGSGTGTDSGSGSGSGSDSGSGSGSGTGSGADDEPDGGGGAVGGFSLLGMLMAALARRRLR